MKRKNIKRWTALLLSFALLFGTVGCEKKEEPSGQGDVLDETYSDSNRMESEQGTNQRGEDKEQSDQSSDILTKTQNPEIINLMEGIESFGLDTSDELPYIPVMKFGLPLFQNALKQAEGENVLISPLSAITVLYMTSLGANNNTKKQMRNVLGSDIGGYLSGLAEDFSKENGCNIQLANGIWYKNDPSLHVKESFLRHSKNFFEAAVYQAPFNDKTLQEINTWVAEQTNDMITQILDEMSEKDIMYLINALSFDAEWQTIYQEHEVWNDIFITESGKEQLVPMLHSREQLYLEDESAIGFIKYYKDQNYAFVALLPKEEICVADYVESLTAEHLNELLNNPVRGVVEVTLPKFSTKYSITLNELLIQLGMPDAFSETDADFSNMATYDNANIYINKVLQKTFFSVDERGTRAGAATAVGMANSLMMMETKAVTLNRPFVYLLVECKYNEPLFMGTILEIEQ